MKASMLRFGSVMLWVAVVILMLVGLYRFLSHHTDHPDGD